MSSQNPQIKKKERSLDLSGMYFCLKLIFWPAYDSQNIKFGLTARGDASPFLMGKKNTQDGKTLNISAFHYRT